MKQYQKYQQEAQLLELPYNTAQLQLLSGTTSSKIQVISFQGIKSLKSVDDSFSKLRIVIASLLIKIFISYHQNNQQKLTTLKKIIYSAKLEQITDKKGIIKQHLFKSIAEKFNSLKIGGNVESDIIKLFNLAPFFDQIVLNAIKQRNPLVVQSDCELRLWLDRQMNIKIILNEEPLLQENQGQLLLIGIGQQFHACKDCKCQECNFKNYKQYIRFSTQSFTDQQMQQISHVYNRKTRSQMFSKLIFQQQEFEHSNQNIDSNLYASVLSSSVDVGGSRLRTPQTQMKKNRNQTFREVGLFQSVNSSTFQKTKSPSLQIYSQRSSQKKPIKVRRNTKDQQSSTLWKILCCKFC